MSKAQRKQSESYSYDREEQSRHYFKIQKKMQDKKILRDLDKALRNKDYMKLVKSDDY